MADVPWLSEHLNKVEEVLHEQLAGLAAAEGITVYGTRAGLPDPIYLVQL